MGLLTPTRRVYHRWRSVLPLYDGRSCPTCGAVVCGREDRRTHREWHMRGDEWDAWVQATLLQVARHAGMTVPELGPRDQVAEVTHVDLRAPEYDEDEEDDDVR